MTREQALNYLYSSGFSEGQVQAVVEALTDEDAISRAEAIDQMEQSYNILDATDRIKALPSVQAVCDDAISREALKKMLIGLDKWHIKNKQFVNVGLLYDDVFFGIEQLPPVTQKSGECKNCKYFEYDSMAKVDGIPLIVAHEICNKWGNGCKTSEDGYCYLYEPQESEDEG